MANELARTFVTIGADDKRLRAGFASVRGFVTAQMTRLNTIATQLQSTLFSPAGIAGGIGLFGIVRAAADFESQMSRVGAVFDFVGEEGDRNFKRVQAAAREMGETTKFTATEAGAALEAMARSGLTVDESIAALPKALQLAAVGNISIAESAGVAANVMRAFGKSAEDLTQINDTLATVLVSANTDIRGIAEALKPVAPIAKAANLSVEETAAVLARMADSGFQGSIAGVALRNALIRLAAPSKEAEKLMRELSINVSDGFFPALEKTQAAIAKMTTEEEKLNAVSTIFGVRGGPQLLAALEVIDSQGRKGFESISALAETMRKNVGLSGRIATRNMDNFAGRLVIMKSAAESAAIALGTQLTARLEGLVKVITVGSAAFARLDPAILGAIASTISWTGAVTGSILAIRTLIGVSKLGFSVLGLLKAPFELATVAMVGFMSASFRAVDIVLELATGLASLSKQAVIFGAKMLSAVVPPVINFALQMPVLATSLTALAVMLAPAAPLLLGIVAFGAGLVKATIAVGGLVAATGLLAKALIFMAIPIAPIAVGFGTMTLLAGAVGAAFVAAARDSETMATVFGKHASLAAHVSEIWGRLKDVLGQVAGTFLKTVNIGNPLLDVWTRLKVVAVETFGKITAFVQRNAAVFRQWGASVGEILNATIDLAIAKGPALIGMLAPDTSKLQGTWDKVKEIITRALDIVNVGLRKFDGVWDLVSLSIQIQVQKLREHLNLLLVDVLSSFKTLSAFNDLVQALPSNRVLDQVGLNFNPLPSAQELQEMIEKAQARADAAKFQAGPLGLGGEAKKKKDAFQALIAARGRERRLTDLRQRAIGAALDTPIGQLGRAVFKAVAAEAEKQRKEQAQQERALRDEGMKQLMNRQLPQIGRNLVGAGPVAPGFGEGIMARRLVEIPNQVAKGAAVGAERGTRRGVKSFGLTDLASSIQQAVGKNQEDVAKKHLQVDQEQLAEVKVGNDKLAKISKQLNEGLGFA